MSDVAIDVYLQAQALEQEQGRKKQLADHSNKLAEMQKSAQGAGDEAMIKAKEKMAKLQSENSAAQAKMAAEKEKGLKAKADEHEEKQIAHKKAVAEQKLKDEREAKDAADLAARQAERARKEKEFNDAEAKRKADEAAKNARLAATAGWCHCVTRYYNWHTNHAGWHQCHG